MIVRRIPSFDRRRSPRRAVLLPILVFSLLQTGCIVENAEFVPVLMYHVISPDPGRTPDHTVIHRWTFEDQMKFLADNGYTTATIGELAEYMRGERKLPPKTVVLTFDDGWNEVLHALPILEKHDFKATFYIFTQPIDDGWWGYLSWPQVAGLAADSLYEVGAHSLTHPWREGDNLVSWFSGQPESRGPTDSKLELALSGQRIETEARTNVTTFAWPSGWYNEDLIEMAKKSGYTSLATSDQGVNAVGDNPYRIRRYPIFGQLTIEQFEQLLGGGVSVGMLDGELVVGDPELFWYGAEDDYDRPIADPGIEQPVDRDTPADTGAVEGASTG